MPGKKGRPPALSPEELNAIRDLILARPDMTIPEIKRSLGLGACRETVRKAVSRMGFRCWKTLWASGSDKSEPDE